MSLDNQIIGIIGCGNLGTALVRGLSGKRVVRPNHLVILDRNPETTALLGKQYPVVAAADMASVLDQASTIVVAVKPKDVPEVLGEIKAKAKKAPALKIISVAAGVTVKQLRKHLNSDMGVVRVMPNLPSIVGQGLAGIYVSSDQDRQAGEIAKAIFASIGETVLVDSEEEIDIITALGAGAPAFMFEIAEALADGGVKMGLTRDVASKISMQVMLGAATLLKETGEHPAVLKDRVASAGGTTIFGLHALEKGALRATIIAAVEASTERAIAMRKE